MSKIEKARFWTGVLYPENMREDWKESIGDIVQTPYAYCCHTQDTDAKSEHRKDHLHLILAFPNTTTYKHVMNVFNLLSAEGKTAINKCEAVIGIRNMYDYLIHDTDTCRKQKKELYSKEERITGNNFDIGAYEQLGIAEKNEIFVELSQAIRENGFMNYMDFYEFVVDTYEDMSYIEIMRSYSGHYERMTKANYQRWQFAQSGICVAKNPLSPRKAHEKPTKTTQKAHENNTKSPRNCCPECGSASLIKRGKTASQSQIWGCKDCGKKFTE